MITKELYANFTELLLSGPPFNYQQVVESDICIYGATAAAITAAVQAATMNHTVAILFFNTQIGGMTPSGLGATDSGNNNVIGGLARKFYTEVGQWYGTNEEQCFFEPHVRSQFLKMA
jgi:ribulose 1,5-bisphosphate synthetase/thiazole synthase